MSSLIVKVVEFDTKPHPNADRLLLATPRGMAWQCCVGKDEMEGQTLGIYVPIDSLVPAALASHLGLPDCLPGEPKRVRTIKLRGLVSQGLLISLNKANEWAANPIPPVVGYNAADNLGITKFAQQYDEAAGVMSNPCGFENPTDIESYNTFAQALPEGTEVVVTEKLHGMAFKAGWVPSNDGGYRFWVGTKDVTIQPYADSPYLDYARRVGLADKLAPYPGVIIYGELYGPGIQKRFHYGEREKAMRVYDVRRTDFVGHDEMVAFANTIGIPTVPELYRGPWSPELVSLADGMCYSNAHIREGIVVKPVEEMFNETIGRVILKIVSQHYLLKNYDFEEVAVA